MAFIQKYWLLILILIILIIVVYKLRQKNKETTLADETIVNNYYTTSGSNSSTVTGAGTGTNSGTGSSTSTAPKIGDRIYAGSTGVNVYKSELATQSNFVKYFGPGLQIGTYLSERNGFTKITMLNPNFGFNDFNVYITGYALTAQTKR